MIDIVVDTRQGLIAGLQVFDKTEEYKTMMDGYLHLFSNTVGKSGTLIHDIGWARQQAFKQGVLPANLNDMNIPRDGEEFPAVMKVLFDYLQKKYPSEFERWATKPSGWDVLEPERDDPRVKWLRNEELTRIQELSNTNKSII